MRQISTEPLTKYGIERKVSPMNTLSTPKKQPRKTAKSAAQDWHKADIKAALEKAGFSLRQLSLSHGKSAGYYREALHRPNPKAEAALAAVLGHTPQTIWPSRYEPCGTPRRGLYKGTNNGRRYKELPTTRSVRVSNGAVTVNRTPEA